MNPKICMCAISATIVKPLGKKIEKKTFWLFFID